LPFDINLIEIYDESYRWAKTLIERTAIGSLTKEGKNNMSTTADTLFTPLTIATAPEGSRPVLESIQNAFGFIPNLMAIFANNPAVLQGYLALDTAYENRSPYSC
jgi:hypothetical protein